MTSEVQHIIALSLNKIVASRSRRGGVSLHRNLLVASVLLRAKDVYIAETVAKRKKDMDAEAVVPNLECHESVEAGQVSPSVDNMETDTSNLPQSGTDYQCSEVQQSDLHNTIEENTADRPVEDQEFHDSVSEQLKQDEVDGNDNYSDISKENVDPNVCVNDCAITKCSRKRRISELELDYSETSSDLQCDSTTDSNSELNCKYIKLDTQCTYIYSSLDYSTKSEQFSNDYTSWDSSNGNIQGDSTENTHYSAYTCPISEQTTTFSPVNLTHTNMLIATV